MEPELRSLNFESMVHVSGIHTDAEKQQSFTHTHTSEAYDMSFTSISFYQTSPTSSVI